MLSAPARAQSQLFNQFVPLDVYGTGIEPDVTVTSRQRKGYDNGGIRAGNFVIRPRLTESAGYETNVLGQTKAVGSGLLQTSGSVDARSDTSRSSIIATAGVEDYRYLDLANQSFTNWNARLGGSYNLGRDIATILVSHDNTSQTPRDLDVPQLSTPLTISIDKVRASYRAAFNRLSLTPEIEAGRYFYNSGNANGVIYDQSYRNRVVVTPGVTAAYEFATRRSAVVVFRNSVGSYLQNKPPNPKRDFNDALLLGGVDYDLNGVLRARVLVGYERRDFSSTVFKTLQAPVAELTLIYIPTGLTTLTGTVARRIQDSADETTSGVTSLSGQLSVDHELRRNILLGATGLITRNEYASGGGSQTLYTGGVSSSYLINRYAAATATYDVTARNGAGNSQSLNLNGLNSGSNYIDHRFLLQLKLSL